MGIDKILAALKVWKWPEYVMGLVKSWREMREARAKQLKAEMELAEYKRNAPIRERKANEEDIGARVQRAKRRMKEEHIARIPEETDEVNGEAIRQIREEATKNWRL